MNQIKLNKFRLNKRQKRQKNLFNLMKEIRVNKYIKNQCKQIHAYKVIGRRREEKKKS